MNFVRQAITERLTILPELVDWTGRPLTASPYEWDALPVSWHDRIVMRWTEHSDLLGPCWAWIGANDGRKGEAWEKTYGKVSKGQKRKHFYDPRSKTGNPVSNGRASVLLHRWTYQEFHGIALWGGNVVDHLCRFRPCFRPDHLECVTHEENFLRGRGPDTTFKSFHSKVDAVDLFCGPDPDSMASYANDAEDDQIEGGMTEDMDIPF